MTPRERLLNVMRGQPADRVPLVLDGFHHARPEHIDDAVKREFAQELRDELHFFHPVGTSVNRYLVTPAQRIRRIDQQHRNGTITTSTEILTPKGALTAVTSRNETTHTVWTEKYPVSSREEIDKIRSIPWELPPGLGPPDLGALPTDFSRRGIVRAGVSSPFVCVAGMMPFEWFLELCVTDLGLIRDLTAQCLQRILAILDVVLADGSVEYVWMGGCEWLTPPMGSPRLYEELVQAFETPIIERVHAAGAVCHVHCHGNVASTLESVIRRGADFFEPMEPPPDGDITFAKAKAAVRGRITLGGNLEARVVENGSPDEVEAAVRAAFAGGRERMVLKTTAGPLCAMTSTMAHNYRRVIDLWRELSPMPDATRARGVSVGN